MHPKKILIEELNGLNWEPNESGGIIAVLPHGTDKAELSRRIQTHLRLKPQLDGDVLEFDYNQLPDLVDQGVDDFPDSTDHKSSGLRK